MRFQHSQDIWQAHPSLVAGVLSGHGITTRPSVRDRVRAHHDAAASRLAAVTSLADLPEVKAWRSAFGRMGLKPTQYRCASESLLRRFAREGDLPQIHPLVDLCNAVSIRTGIPIAVIDLAHVVGDLEVRPASGVESYVAFSGAVEHPVPGEVVFVDDAGNAHARRWTHRQSALSAIRPDTDHVLVVAEGLHADAGRDVRRVLDTLESEIRAVWGAELRSGVLSAASPAFDTA